MSVRGGSPAPSDREGWRRTSLSRKSPACGPEPRAGTAPHAAPPPPGGRPHVHADRRPFLIGRNRIQAALRGFFAARDFVEVDTAALQVSPGNEAHLHAFATEARRPDGSRRGRSTFTPRPNSPARSCWRRARRASFVLRPRVPQPRARAPAPPGIHHARMVPGGRALRSPDAGLRRDPARSPPTPAGLASLAFRGRAADPFPEPERLTRGRSLPALRRNRPPRHDRRRGATDRERLRRRAGDRRLGSRRTTPGPTCSAGSSSSGSSPTRPSAGPRSCDEYPVAEAALARPDARRPTRRRAVRALCLRGGARQRLWRAHRPGGAAPALRGRDGREERVYGERYPVDEDFLAALAQMPEASGIALGFDRLVMLATGAPTSST